MNDKTLRVLEYNKIVNMLMEKAESQLGKDRVSKISPLIQIVEIEKLQKENTALYKLAERMLDEENKSFVEIECNKVEEKATEIGLQNKYIKLVTELENKYK